MPGREGVSDFPSSVKIFFTREGSEQVIFSRVKITSYFHEDITVFAQTFSGISLVFFNSSVIDVPNVSEKKLELVSNITPLLAVICADSFQSPSGESKLIRLSVSDIDCKSSYSFPGMRLKGTNANQNRASSSPR